MLKKVEPLMNQGWWVSGHGSTHLSRSAALAPWFDGTEHSDSSLRGSRQIPALEGPGQARGDPSEVRSLQAEDPRPSGFAVPLLGGRFGLVGRSRHALFAVGAGSRRDLHTREAHWWWALSCVLVQPFKGSTGISMRLLRRGNRAQRWSGCQVAPLGLAAMNGVRWMSGPWRPGRPSGFIVSERPMVLEWCFPARLPRTRWTSVRSGAPQVVGFIYRAF